MTDERQTDNNLPNNETDQENPPETARWVILSFIAGLIVAALALEYYGYIVHPNKNDQALINELKLLSLKPEFDIKVSSKASGKESLCVNGYLLLRPTNGKSVAGIVVDEKNRPIDCHLVAASTDKEETDKGGIEKAREAADATTGP